MNIKQRTAGELMTEPIIPIAKSATLRAAAAKMNEHHVHCLLVPPDDSRRCTGIITIKDIVQVLCEGETEMLGQLRVEDVMTTPAVSVQRDFLIADCIRLMRMAGVRSAPVLEGTRVVGLLSFTDVLRALTREAS